MKATPQATYKRGAEVSDEDHIESQVDISGQIGDDGNISWGVWCSICHKMIGERSEDDEYLERTELEHTEFHQRSWLGLARIGALEIRVALVR